MTALFGSTRRTALAVLVAVAAGGAVAGGVVGAGTATDDGVLLGAGSAPASV